MITLEILDYNRNFVSEWSWEDNFPIPSKGDTILVHLGDDNEMEYRRLAAINTAAICENMTKIHKELQKKGGEE